MPQYGTRLGIAYYDEQVDTRKLDVDRKVGAWLWKILGIKYTLK